VQALGIEDILDCYRSGVFPMGEARDDDRIFLIEPKARAVIPLERLKVSKRLARTVRSGGFEVRIDTAFTEVVRQCAAPGPGRRDTWINRPIEQLYADLFRLGHAHSVEVWRAGKLAGGLYGVSIGGAFFGESMFSAVTDASKVALVHLVARLNAGGYRLLDAQFMTDHLASLGAEEISRKTYLKRLETALEVEGDFYRLAAFAGPDEVLQATSQAS
jgi:leucyl/phenylalanyl-tRNA--protein transferase